MSLLKLRTNVPPPIASNPKRGGGIRLTEDGEECERLKKVTEGVLVRLVRDGYLAVVLESEIV